MTLAELKEQLAVKALMGGTYTAISNAANSNEKSLVFLGTVDVPNHRHWLLNERQANQLIIDGYTVDREEEYDNGFKFTVSGW